MVKFLIQRPIAVTMAFLAIVILGCVTYVSLPVSLLPEVPIPHITVRIDGGDLSAREVEYSLTSPLRRQLMQVEGLKQMRSETTDNAANIDLTMEYGVDTDLAFVEVNEKIDAAMASLPPGLPRPKAIKASATDIPVVYVSVTLRDASGNFSEAAEVASDIIRRRLEQLPEVAMADITGLPSNELQIFPDKAKMLSAGISDSDIEKAITAANSDPGSMSVRDGYYEYNVQVDNRLVSADDVKDVMLTKNGRHYKIGDLCRVTLAEKAPSGYSTYNGKRAVTMALIKHSSASMSAMHRAVDSTLDYFRQQYPSLSIATSRSQSQLLDFTISNLEQNLLLGLILVFIVCAVFMKSLRLPFVIGITIIVAVIMTFLLFYLFRVSINIVSLSGLILAVGMMIDNSVIVAENITQYRRRGLGLDESCVKGTNEMITPMLSSSLTTVAVFVPLVFMSGIAGAIFADQAFAITAGLTASYITGITLMPVLYRLFFNRGETRTVSRPAPRASRLTLAYDRGIDFVFRHKLISLSFVLISLAALVPLFRVLDTERMPHIDSAETLLTIDWNENINIAENRRRTEEVAGKVAGLSAEHSAYVGIRDYMLDNDGASSTSRTELYLRVHSPSELPLLRDSLSAVIAGSYPLSSHEFAPVGNVFDKVFSTSEPPLEARLSLRTRGGTPEPDLVGAMTEKIASATGQRVTQPPLREQINITINREAALLYGVDVNEVAAVLRGAFRGNDAGVLRSFQDYVPVRIANPDATLRTTLTSAMVRTSPDRDGHTREVPLKALVSTTPGSDFKSLLASESGEYYPVAFQIADREADDVQQTVKEVVAEDGSFDVTFTGSIFSNRKMMNELTVILLVSLLMMYFIMCAQFESFLQPLIVLVEIPIDITFALLTLWVCGQTLNLMSAIGIIVTCGIVVNDSILKLDSINELRKEGAPLLEAIHTAGQRRLKPILMTSITTVAAMVPVLFTSDMGSELQRPLALALIGSMIIGTAVSIFIIPLIYYLIYHRKV